MSLQAREQLHFCITGGRTIILNLTSGRYLGLPRDVDRRFQKAIASDPDQAFEPDLIAYLSGQGITIASERGLVRPCQVSIPVDRSSIRRRELPPSSAFMATRLVIAQVDAQIRLKSLSFSSIVGALRRRKERVANRQCPSASIDKIEAALVATNLLLRPYDRCLPRSLAFFSVCLSQGIAPTFVIGVRANPFRAHCWVQTDEAVCHDDAEQAALFTPIFAL